MCEINLHTNPIRDVYLYYHMTKYFMHSVNIYSLGVLFFSMIGFLISGMLFCGCAKTPVIGAPLVADKLKDGIYKGSYSGGPNKALVKVTIKDKTIVKIEIVAHFALKGIKAESPIVKRIISSQSTNVDAVSGATNSSYVIMNAVHKAIEKAYQH